MTGAKACMSPSTRMYVIPNRVAQAQTLFDQLIDRAVEHVRRVEQLVRRQSLAVPLLEPFRQLARGAQRLVGDLDGPRHG